jgi:hypothetical protein
MRMSSVYPILTYHDPGTHYERSPDDAHTMILRMVGGSRHTPSLDAIPSKDMAKNNFPDCLSCSILATE